MPNALDILLDKIHSEQDEQPSIRSLIAASGMTQKAFAEHFSIPIRTVENWAAGIRKCPDYVISLIEYKLRGENLIKKEPRA